MWSQTLDQANPGRDQEQFPPSSRGGCSPCSLFSVMEHSAPEGIEEHPNPELPRGARADVQT